MDAANEHGESSENAPVARLGRQPSTSHSQLSHLALQLFIERGFADTTVDDIALAAGIGRRTLFRYFPSKNDLPWGDFDAGLRHMRAYLSDIPDSVSLMDALSAAVVDFNSFPAEEVRFHRERMNLLLNVPALVAHSSLRYIEWRQVVAEYVARRLGVDEDGLEPQVIAYAVLGLCLSSYEQWLKHDEADLSELLRAAFAVLGAHT